MGKASLLVPKMKSEREVVSHLDTVKLESGNRTGNMNIIGTFHK